MRSRATTVDTNEPRRDACTTSEPTFLGFGSARLIIRDPALYARLLNALAGCSEPGRAESRPGPPGALSVFDL